MTTATITFFKTKTAAEAVTGTLSSPDKMPCKAYSLPASACITGSQLQKVDGSTCSDCYACKGRYVMPNTVNAMQRRIDSLSDPLWVSAMVRLINGMPYFRWHDSGDLQSLIHLVKIVHIAEACPDTQFWLPTRERKFVNEYLSQYGAFPSNLTVRVSAAMIDGAPPSDYELTSTVHDRLAPIGHACPAYQQDNKCGDCRACWDKSVPNVSYPKH